MNIQTFLNNYENKHYFKPNPKTWDTKNEEIEYLFSNFGGLTIDFGLFRIHTYESSKKWTTIITASFPKYENKIIPFGFDWLGRQYVLNTSQDKTINMFDGATGEDFKLEQNLEDFFNEELVDYGTATLASDDFESWNTEKNALKHNEIVAFKIPLALSGKDSPENYQVTDAEVDWEINSQLLEK